ncbi:hypothetical protein K491DRAFT_240122 [Lophiostoma macrostomum CBS 122681]|uniref:Cora-domain-containing protein n=1 Tax=Lophiostoma macrostomum CBS 122681 TaxID=1314788 RepID=A0A6A6SL75_9PLEO|nr:hypothetical protein K491DRAFT_240122 [Lophiostoma macrostomum CBS 122681]
MASSQSQKRPDPIPSQNGRRRNRLMTVAVDEHTLEEFTTEYRHPSNTSEHDLDLHIFEWDKNVDGGVGRYQHYKSVDDIYTLEKRQIRVIFAPRHIAPDPRDVNSLAHFFHKFAVPRAFVAESLRAISQSFGAQTDSCGTEYTWFHVLAKDVAISNAKKGRRRIVQTPEDSSTTAAPGDRQYSGDGVGRAKGRSQANFSWVKPGFVLKIEHDEASPASKTDSPNNSTGSINTLVDSGSYATLLCFGAPRTFERRFQNLQRTATSDDLMEDPYYLLELVLDGMWQLMDNAGWLVSEVFGEIEGNTLDLADSPAKANKEVDFPGLHNLAKHAIYMRENIDSAMYTLECLYARHKYMTGDNPKPAQLFTRQALDYRKTMFYSTQRRLSSLEKRMENILQLSFHWVTQSDSLIMLSESLSMKAIAVATLVFMPLGTVAAIFGTQLISLEDDPPHHARVSQDFWLLWVISVPLTLFVIMVWRVWYHDKRAQLKGKARIREDGERGYMGWKRVGEKGFIKLEDLRRRLQASEGKLEREEREMAPV